MSAHLDGSEKRGVNNIVELAFLALDPRDMMVSAINLQNPKAALRTLHIPAFQCFRHLF